MTDPHDALPKSHGKYIITPLEQELAAENTRLRALLQKTLDEGWVDYGAELSNEIVAELGNKP